MPLAPSLPVDQVEAEIASAVAPDVPQGQLTQQIGHHLASLTSLISSLTVKAENVDDLQKEAEMWKVSFLRATREIEGFKSECEILRERLDKADGRTRDNAGPPFSAVLIDGDGLIFHESLLIQGRKGGQKAAQTLLSSLPDIATRLETEASGEPRKLGQIVVMIFVNKTGLAGALLKAGSIPSYSALESFFAGFSASHDLFSVIDVGQGKEASDAKIREYLKLYAANAQCGMILLGASHDNGYATVLSSLKTESRLNNLLLLKGYTSLASQIGQLSLNHKVVSLPELFRTERVGEQRLTAAAAPRRPAAGLSIYSDTSDTPKEKTGLIWSERTSEPNSARSKASLIIEKGSTDSEWEEERPEEQMSKSERRRAGINKKSVPKGKATTSAGKNAKSVRFMNPRPCHSHYLSVLGCKTVDCPHGHDYDLSDAQTMELAKYAKQIVCPYLRQGRCRFEDDECVYGHACPNGRACPFGEACRFNSLFNGHPADESDFTIPDTRSILKASKMAGNLGWS